ncbi:hypothetical protein B9Z55_013005 [Caenorhabditis nigoni]|uniref:Uncharacterized protein n=1 Tax=Caenorhabditis nigoni TaxID=1611254 RepID=A0A2G5TZU4_9PELO|nr:hypothetical protein B9Z55_013005 [Caenorhabditis nigoni]
MRELFHRRHPEDSVLAHSEGSQIGSFWMDSTIDFKDIYFLAGRRSSTYGHQGYTLKVKGSKRYQVMVRTTETDDKDGDKVVYEEDVKDQVFVAHSIRSNSSNASSNTSDVSEEGPSPAKKRRRSELARRDGEVVKKSKPTKSSKSDSEGPKNTQKIGSTSAGSTSESKPKPKPPKSTQPPEPVAAQAQPEVDAPTPQQQLIESLSGPGPSAFKPFPVAQKEKEEKEKRKREQEEEEA